MTIKNELLEINLKNKKEEIINKIKELSISKALIFSNKKRDIEAINKALNEAGLKSSPLYNGMEDEVKEEAVKFFNENKDAFLVCSDSVAKKVNLNKIDYIIGSELPTRANDYKIRLSYLGEKGMGITFHSGEDEDKIAEVNKVMNKKSEKSVKNEKVEKSEKVTPAKKTTVAKTSNSFGGHIPEFLQIDISYLLDKAV